MNRTTRVLLFPVATAIVTTLTGCDGITPTDPSVRACHDDTTRFEVRRPDGSAAEGLLVQHDDPRRCRNAA